MSKAMLIMDMPESCMECVLYALHNTQSLECECRGTKVYNGYVKVHPKIDRKLLNKRQDWCPLKEVPKKMAEETRWFDIKYVKGYNACIDKILGRQKQ